VDLRWSVGETLPEALADGARVGRVLTNLIGNAIKFTPAGGRIEVTAYQRDGALCFTVTDTGPGIPADQLPKLFDPFWQAGDHRQRGIGLGLAIAKGIVQAHGGDIWVESRPGEGSRFSFTLPRNPG
jgi:signal transduction histidine kinase